MSCWTERAVIPVSPLIVVPVSYLPGGIRGMGLFKREGKTINKYIKDEREGKLSSAGTSWALSLSSLWMVSELHFR